MKTILSAIRKFFRNIRGAILIEFAVGMPLLLLLLFGMHDIFKMVHIKDKTNFAAHLVVQMLQNVSRARKDKKITETDIANIARFVSYVIYPGTTVYVAKVNYRHFYAHTIFIGINYIRGESGGKATTVWRLFYRPNTSSRTKTCTMTKTNNTLASSYFNSPKTNVDPSEIWPALRISEGEVKIIVEVFIVATMYPDATKPPSKQLFGLHLLTPTVKGDSASKGYFHSHVIFTPRRGIFDEEGPDVTYLE